MRVTLLRGGHDRRPRNGLAAGAVSRAATPRAPRPQAAGGARAPGEGESAIARRDDAPLPRRAAIFQPGPLCPPPEAGGGRVAPPPAKHAAPQVRPLGPTPPSCAAATGAPRTSPRCDRRSPPSTRACAPHPDHLRPHHRRCCRRRRSLAARRAAAPRFIPPPRRKCPARLSTPPTLDGTAATPTPACGPSARRCAVQPTRRVLTRPLPAAHARVQRATPREAPPPPPTPSRVLRGPRRGPHVCLFHDSELRTLHPCRDHSSVAPMCGADMWTWAPS